MCQKESSMTIKGRLSILLVCLLSCLNLYSQSSEDRAYGAYQQLEDLTYDAIASFVNIRMFIRIPWLYLKL